MPGEQKIRAVLFYLSVIIFLSGLPFILAFALGYKLDPNAFKFTKTGMIALKTQPQGASVFLNERLFNERTPTSLDELLPGKYNVKLKLEKHYSWEGDVSVEAGKVSRLDKIILFPLRPNIKQVNKFQFSSFWLDRETNTIYYLNRDEKSIYKSNLEGGHFEKIADFLEISPRPKKWLLSEDRKKLLYYNSHQIAVIYLESRNDDSPAGTPFVLNYPDSAIVDVFWNSDNYHLVLVTGKKIEVQEARPKGISVSLVTLNKGNTFASYDVKTDTLYFIDAEKAADGNYYDNLYTLQLNNKLYPFQELIKLTPNFEKAGFKINGKEPEKK